MPELEFRIEAVEVARYAATPLLNFKLRVSCSESEPEIANVCLQCQIQIEGTRRHYEATEQAGLEDLFGQAERWGQTLRSLLWTHAAVLIPAFRGDCLVDLPVPCSFDFNVVATQYFHSLEQGEIPSSFQFSGTVFHRAEDESLRVSQIPWGRDARFRLPVALWRQMMDHYYPNSAWLCLRRDVFDRLRQYKLRHGLPSWEEALEHALGAVEESVE